MGGVQLPSSKSQNYLHGAAIMTVAVAIIKILGAIYRIPLGNILGEVGFAHFNVAHNLFSVLLTLSTAGLPIALAKLISEEVNSLDRLRQVRKIFRVALTAFVVLGGAGTILMFIFPTQLADFMGDIYSSMSILVLAPSVLLVCIMSAFRGYTQGFSDMRPTSISQIIEVAVKVAFGLSAVMILQRRGAGMPILSAGAISGVAAGSIVACLYMSLVAKKRMNFENIRALEKGSVNERDMEGTGTVLKRLAKIGAPIALGASVLSVITLINTILVLSRLQDAAGFTFLDAKIMFGAYSMALTLFNLPAAIITPLTISIVPAIAGFIASKKFSEAKDVIESSLRIATVIALPMAVGLSVLSGPIMSGIYYGRAQQQGPMLLAILGVASFFVCLALITTAILQAGGRERLPMYTMLFGGIVNIVLNWFLLGIPYINIFGAPLGTLACYILMSGLNLYFIMSRLPERPKLGNIFFKPAFSCIIMAFVAWLVYPAMIYVLRAGPAPGRLMILIAMSAAIGAAAFVYFALIIITRTITMDDMKLVPKGEKLGKLLRIR